MKQTLICVWIVMNANVGKGLPAGGEIIEHQVFGKEALEQAGKLMISEGKRLHPSCRKCSPKENFYCRGRNLLHDHCCCDRRHREKFYFIPHTCYAKLSATCEPVAGDCEEYSRLYECCCLALVASRWRKFSSQFAVSKVENRNLLRTYLGVYRIIAALTTYFMWK